MQWYQVKGIIEGQRYTFGLQADCPQPFYDKMITCDMEQAQERLQVVKNEHPKAYLRIKPINSGETIAADMKIYLEAIKPPQYLTEVII